MKKKHTAVVILTALVVAALLGGGIWFLLRGSDFSRPAAPAQDAGSASLPPAATATPSPTPEPTPGIYTISLIGDCTLASSQYDDEFDRVIQEHDLKWPFSGTVNYLGNDEFTLANLECTFSDTALTSGVLFYFRAPTTYTGILTAGSIEGVTLGNNHTDDFGAQGVDDTMAALDAAGVGYVGAGDSRVFETAHGLKIGVYCPGWLGLSEANVQSGIAALQALAPDVIIFAPHWGKEGSYTATETQERLAHAAIDAGADIVCGTHPHVLQRAEEYQGKYIFYSLGNFSFGGNTAPRDRDTAIVQITVTEQRDGTHAISGYSFIPCCLSSTDGSNDFCPTPYDVESEDYARVMQKLDGTFDGPDLTVDYSFLD